MWVEDSDTLGPHTILFLLLLHLVSCLSRHPSTLPIALTHPRQLRPTTAPHPPLSVMPRPHGWGQFEDGPHALMKEPGKAHPRPAPLFVVPRPHRWGAIWGRPAHPWWRSSAKPLVWAPAKVFYSARYTDRKEQTRADTPYPIWLTKSWSCSRSGYQMWHKTFFSRFCL